MRLSHRHRNVITLKRSLLSAFATAGFFAFFSLQPWAEKLENMVARPLEFEVRRRLKKDPAIDPRIQIYVVEDATVQYLKKEGLSLDDWMAVISGFKELKPRAIFVDKIFGIPGPDAEAKEFASKIKGFSFPVIAGAFIVPSVIKNRPILAAYDLNEKINSGTSRVVKGADELNWLPIEPGYPYGPAENIRDAFRYVGHIMYSGDSYFKPVVRISTYQGMPGAPFMVSKDLHFDDEQLVVDGSAVPMDRKGRTLVNFVAPSLFYDRTDKMSLLFELAREKKPFPKIPEDSVIMLLPNQYTGNIDFAETPFGKLPGGYMIASVINSVMTGQWIRTTPLSWLITLVSGLASALIIMFWGGYAFWLVSGAVLLTLVTFGLLSFSYLGMAFPWFFSVLSLFSSSCMVFAINAGELLRRRIEGIAGTASPLEVKYDEKTGQPKKLGRYHIIERIGKGGMGEVYRAKIYGAGGFEKEFALKRVSPEYWTDKTVIQAFLDEARVSSFLNHLNIVQVFEFLRLEDSYLLVMEYVRGKNLSEILKLVKRGKLNFPLELGAYIASEVCKALEYAHAKTDPKTGIPLKIIHRDISPHNILLAEDGTVKIIDFGIAKGAFNTEHTKTGMIKGKLAYMSPEQASGKPMDRRSDLFSTAIVLHELVTGKKTFGTESEQQTLKQVKEWNVQALSFQNLDVPTALMQIIQRGLEREPDKRYQKAADMYQDLANYLSQSRFGIGQKVQSELLKSVFELEARINDDNTPTTSIEGTIVSKIEVDERRTGTF